MADQLFRIDTIHRTMDGKQAVINANHITYDVNKAVVLPFQTTGIANALSGIKQNTLYASSYPFTFSTDIVNASSKFKVSAPLSWRQAIGGVDGSLLDTFSGANNFCEIQWDNLNIAFFQHRGH